jgi:hypothetical protein
MVRRISVKAGSARRRRLLPLRRSRSQFFTEDRNLRRCVDPKANNARFNRDYFKRNSEIGQDNFFV